MPHCNSSAAPPYIELMDGFFGRTIRERAFGGFRLIEKRHAPREILQQHQHELPYATFVISGGYLEDVNGRCLAVPKGSVLLHAGGERHADRFGDAPAVLLNVEFPPAEGPWREAGAFRPAVHPDLQMLGSRLRSELYEWDDVSPMIVEGIMLELCGLARRHGPAQHVQPLIAGRADAVIRERFAEKLALQDVAAEVGVEAASLARLFRRVMGRTIGERIRERRIERARELLFTSATLAEIALATGFADQSHFTRTFHAMTGMTPKVYRRAIG